jgi:hypothetical protein
MFFVNGSTKTAGLFFVILKSEKVKVGELNESIR